MQKSFKNRLEALEAVEQRRSGNAIRWALTHLNREEFARFVAFWRREQARPGIYPEPGAEAAAVDRYGELVELAYIQGLTPTSRRL